MKPTTTALAVLFIVGVAIAARLPFSHVDWFADGRVYSHAALTLLHHGAYDLVPEGECNDLADVQPATCRLPGFPSLLALIAPRAANREDFTLSIRLLNLVADLLTAFFVFRLLSRCAVAGWLRLLTVAAVLLHPTLLRFSFAGITESIATALTLGWLWLLVAHDAPSSLRVASTGLLLGFAALLRADFLFIAPALMAAQLMRDDDSKRMRNVAVLVLALACMAVPIAAWTVRNHARTNQWMTPFAPSCDLCGRRQTSAGAKAWLATFITREEEVPLDWALIAGRPAPTIANYPATAFASDAERERAAAWLAQRNTEGLDERVDRAFAALATEHWRAQPLASLVVTLERAGFLVLTRSSLFGDAPSLRPLGDTWKRAWPWLAALLLIASALGFGLAAREGLQRRLVVLATITISARIAGLAYVGGVEQRYANEIWPVILVGAALLVARLVRRAPRP